MKPINVTFQTLTPLWTGDAWGKSDNLKLTGIIGSLRWWFEALVRGMGYKACDITSNDCCKLEIKSPKDVLKIHEKICPACYLFGTTGWKSRFSVGIENDSFVKPYNGKIIVRINNGRGWHYESRLMGETELTFRYDRGIISENTFFSILKILLYLISEYGLLGAKTSMGYGVVKFKINDSDISVNDTDWENFKNYLELFENKFKSDINHLPSLKDFFFVKFKVSGNIENIINNVKSFFSYEDGIIETDIVNKWKNENWCITSPVVRKCIRCIFRGQFSKSVCWHNRSCTRNYWWNYYNENDNRNRLNKKYNSNLTIDSLTLGKKKKEKTKNIRHFLMGSTSEPEFSAIQISHVYNDLNNLEFRIYGWLPDIEPIKGKINDIIKLLIELFKNTPPWSSKLPSSIQNNICWDSSDLKKINSNIRALFVKNGNQGDSQ